MKSICAEGLAHKELNEAIRAVHEPCTVFGVCGQRFIAAGTSDQELTIEGIPGNALGAYLNGGTVTVELSSARAALERRLDTPCEEERSSFGATPVIGQGSI